jgi:hypothetical protein
MQKNPEKTPHAPWRGHWPGASRGKAKLYIL